MTPTNHPDLPITALPVLGEMVPTGQCIVSRALGGGLPFSEGALEENVPQNVPQALR